MAAALADRHAIAIRLLQSAGNEACTLARAINKYGQTAAHLAARKGSQAILMALLSAGGRSIAMACPLSPHVCQAVLSGARA